MTKQDGPGRSDGIGVSREYVIECEHTAGDVWTPVGLYAIEGANDRLVRCRDCETAFRAVAGQLVCDAFPESRHVTDPDGYCHRGTPRGGA